MNKQQQQVINGKGKTSEIQNVRKEDNKKTSVFLRLRSRITAPYAVENNIFKIVNSKSDIVSKCFTFTNIFGHETTQKQLYDMCVEQAIDKEENLTVLTYGSSNSGKTFSLVGDEKHPGIIPRAIEQILSHYRKNMTARPTLKIVKGEWSILNDESVEAESNIRELYFNNSKYPSVSSAQQQILSEHRFANGTADSKIVSIWISFVEIYNENVADLLDLSSKKGSKKRTSLSVISNGGNAYISGLSSVLVKSYDEALLLLEIGVKARQIGATNINPQSSRSHCIFIVDVIKQYQSKSQISHISYKFCDLAGSERLKKTEAEGARCQEAKKINKSLSVLGRCLNSIYNNQHLKTKEIVPFRESKLTFFLQSSLTGHEKLSFIVHMLPSADFYEENEQVLKFSSMAKEIVYQKPLKRIAGRRSTFSNFLFQVDSNHVQLVLDENERLKEKISLLETELIELDGVEQNNREIEELRETVVQLKQENTLKQGNIEKRHVLYDVEEESDEDPIYTDTPNLHKVEKIIGQRIRNGKKEYLVDWSPSWVPKKDVTKDLIGEFIEKQNKNHSEKKILFAVSKCE